MRRRRIVGAMGAVVLEGMARSGSGALAAPTADAVRRLIEALGGARSFKVRVQAALLLSRVRGDVQVGQALGRAIVSDPHPLVRGTSVRLLGKNPMGNAVGAQQARIALGRALSDRDAGVRRKAALALAELRASPFGGRPTESAPTPIVAPAPAARGAKVIALGTIGDRTGKAPQGFRERLKGELRALLGGQAGVRIGVTGGADVAFVIDGTIAKLQFAGGGPDVEVTCAIELVLSRPPRGIMTIASGEATVQKPRAFFRPALRAAMEEEALSHAVRSAHDNVARFLASQ